MRKKIETKTRKPRVLLKDKLIAEYERGYQYGEDCGRMLGREPNPERQAALGPFVRDISILPIDGGMSTIICDDGKMFSFTRLPVSTLKWVADELKRLGY